MHGDLQLVVESREPLGEGDVEDRLSVSWAAGNVGRWEGNVNP